MARERHIRQQLLIIIIKSKKPDNLPIQTDTFYLNQYPIFEFSHIYIAQISEILQLYFWKMEFDI